MTAPETVTPFVPVRYSEEEGRLAQIMAGRKVRAGIRIGRLGALIRLFYEMPEVRPGKDPEKGAEPMLALEIRGRLWQLSFGRTRFFYDLLEQADPSGTLGETPAESIPGQILAAMVEAFIGPELARLEAVLGEAVTLAEPDTDLGGKLALPFSIGFGTDARVPGRLHFPGDGLDLLEKLTAGCERRTWAPDAIRALKKQVALQAGTLALDLEQFSGLAPGDVLIPDRWLPGEGRLELGLGRDSLVCAMDADAMTLTLTGARRAGTGAGGQAKNHTTKDNHPMANQETAGTSTQETPAEQDKNQDPSVIGGKLELELVFELGRITMTVGEIGELSRGRVITLPVLPREGVGVDIRISSQVVARGRIVSLGRDAGIQITQINTTGTGD